LQGRQAGTEYARKAAEYIVKQWEEIGIEPYSDHSYFQPFSARLFRKKTDYQNIVGVIRGNDAVLKNEFILVGAHYDHIGFSSKQEIYNGADDNASGVAALTELGRELIKVQSNLKRSVILVAFDAEEAGLLGSTHYIYHSEASNDDIKLMLSLDMVGWYKGGKIKYIGSGTIKGGSAMILNPQLVPSGLNVAAKKFETGIFWATDTQPFAQKKIPTLWVNTGLKSPLHTPNDKAHLIDYDGMALITEHLKNVVESISRDTDYQPSGKISPKHKSRQQRITYGVLANFGSRELHYTTKTHKDTSSFSFGAGFVSQVNFGYVAIRPELLYDRSSAKHHAGTLTTNNLTVPLSLVLQTPKNLFWGLDIFFGGYYSYCIGGKLGSEKIDFENTFNRSESGLTYGGSAYLMPFKIGFTGRTALTDFTKSTAADHATIRNRTMYCTLTYLF
jgi:hypothetical protein